MFLLFKQCIIFQCILQSTYFEHFWMYSRKVWKVFGFELTDVFPGRRWRDVSQTSFSFQLRPLYQMLLRSLPMQSVQLFWVVHNSWLSSNQRTRHSGCCGSIIITWACKANCRTFYKLLAALKSLDSTFDQDPERNDWFAQRGFVKPSAHDAACSSQVLELRNMRTFFVKSSSDLETTTWKVRYDGMTLPYFALVHLSSLFARNSCQLPCRLQKSMLNALEKSPVRRQKPPSQPMRRRGLLSCCLLSGARDRSDGMWRKAYCDPSDSSFVSGASVAGAAYVGRNGLNLFMVQKALW